MNSIFHFCPLQYRYDSALGEVLNVGLLVLFPKQKTGAFVYPKNLNRLKSAYPNGVAEHTIKAVLEGIENKVTELNNHPETFSHYSYRMLELIDDKILIRDASALQFGEIKSSILYTNDLAEVVTQLEKLYLSAY